MLRKILIGLLLAFVLIQFIRPARNNKQGSDPQDIAAVYAVPQDAYLILQRSCLDCHSNHTSYPWYSNIQPIGWWLQHHVNEGKGELNFSEFGSYSKKKKLHKLDEVVETIEKKEMPLGSYTFLHKDAALSQEQAAVLISWAKNLKQQIETTEPSN